MVVDCERSCIASEGGDLAQGDLAIAGAGEIDVIEAVGVLPELWGDFHDDVILVELSVHDGDLALAEGVGENGVDGLWRDAEAAGAVAIDGDFGFETMNHLVGVDIGEAGEGFEFFEDFGGPVEKFLEIVALEGVLPLGVAGAAADADILGRLEIEGDAGDF